MKKHLISILLLLVFLSCIFLSCEKESPNTIPNLPRKQACEYLLVDLQVDLPIDLNFDGRSNIDLRKETDAFQLNSCQIFFSLIETDNTLMIAWPEPQVDANLFLGQELPEVYEGQTVSYHIVPRYYIRDINYTRTRMYLEEAKEEYNGWQTYFTFTGPTVLEIDKEQNTISFQAHQVFLTQKGRESREITAIFKANPEYGYFQ
ncbi:MAG: hypothetical protein FWD60_00630 [Candidatus Azobacteroides sp.]|nr:hypothetical protein [Candidatus Azobacteroides sp.]